MGIPGNERADLAARSASETAEEEHSEFQHLMYRQKSAVLSELSGKPDGIVSRPARTMGVQQQAE